MRCLASSPVGITIIAVHADDCVTAGDEASTIIEEPAGHDMDMKEVLGILNDRPDDGSYKVRFAPPPIGPRLPDAWVAKDAVSPQQIEDYEQKRLGLSNCAIEGEREDQTDDDCDGADADGAEDNLDDAGADAEMWNRDHDGGLQGRRNDHTEYDFNDGFVERTPDGDLTMYEGVPPGVDPQEHAKRAAKLRKLKTEIFETTKDRLRPARADGLSSQPYVHATTLAARTRGKARWERSLLEDDSDDDTSGWLIGGLARWLAGYQGGRHRGRCISIPTHKGRHAGTQARKPAGPQARTQAGGRRVKVPSTTALSFHVNNF